jgi:hypothetical protein
MILASLGKFSVAQAITDADEISENVIQIATVDWGAMTDVWWVVQTNVVAATAGTLKFELVLDTQVGLDGTQVQVCCVDIAAITDKRTATAGRFIAALNVTKTLAMMLEEDVSDYAFIGMENTLSAATTITIDAWLSFTEPHTLQHRMEVESNIDNSITVASAGSGA